MCCIALIWCLFICLLLCYPCLSAHLYQNISVSNIDLYPDAIDFTIFTTNVEGLIFFSTDKVEHFITIRLHKLQDDSREFLLDFKGHRKNRSMKEFCGRESVRNSTLNFKIYRRHNWLSVACNNLGPVKVFTYPGDKVHHVHGYPCSSSYLNGNISVSDNVCFPKDIYFKVLTTNNEGVLLYITDSASRTLSLTIQIQSSGKRLLVIEFNSMKKRYYLKDFCGSAGVGNVDLEFRILRISNYLNVTCNRSKPYLYHCYHGGTKKGRERSSVVHIYMGNNKSLPDTHGEEGNQLYGCLKEFKYMNKAINFTEIGSKFRSQCPPSCDTSECTDAQCLPMYKVNATCDCVSSNRRPVVCKQTINESEAAYYSNENNTHFTSLDFAWSNNVTKFIILEIITRAGTLQIFVEDLNEIGLRRVNSTITIFQCNSSLGDPRLNQLHITASPDLYTVMCTATGLKMDLNIRGRTGQTINNNFKVTVDRNLYCNCYISFLYENSNAYTSWILRDPTGPLYLPQSKGFLTILVILRSIGIFMIAVFAITNLVWCCQGWAKNKRKESSPSTNVVDINEGVDTVEPCETVTSEDQIYDKLDYDLIDSPDYTSDENEYMMMSPTLPPRIPHPTLDQ